MQTSLSSRYLNTQSGREAEKILRSCVHCGFCTATCPTYQLLGDELDSPRGRIYLIKELLEGNDVSETTLTHLDRCLLCRSCETTCPSGVQYGRLLDSGRILAEEQCPRPWYDKIFRRAINDIFIHAGRLRLVLKLMRIVSPLLPSRFKLLNSPKRPTFTPAERVHSRKMLLLGGCVQSQLAGSVNQAAVRLLDALGIQAQQSQLSECCGALSYHLNYHTKAKQMMRDNIDRWWPFVEAGTEAIIVTASGCAPMLKDYAHVLQDDPCYAEKASTISRLAKDVCEVISAESCSELRATQQESKIVFQSPCSLQHGQKITGAVESILRSVGYQLQSYPDAHLCCGAAGSYSLLQSSLSEALLKNKINNLESTAADCVATSNVGCLLHLKRQASVPVVHWLELLEPR